MAFGKTPRRRPKPARCEECGRWLDPSGLPPCPAHPEAAALTWNNQRHWSAAYMERVPDLCTQAEEQSTEWLRTYFPGVTLPSLREADALRIRWGIPRAPTTPITREELTAFWSQPDRRHPATDPPLPPAA